MNNFASLLRRRPHFRRLWLSEVVSLLGDWMGFVAVSLLALREGGGAVALALVFAGNNLPHALLAPVAGALADRLDRKRLMVGANVAQGALTVGMAIAATGGHIALLQVIVLVRAAVAAFLPPVQSAAMRHVVREDELIDANTISSLTWSVMFAVGMAAGGLIAALGPAVALLIDAASFGVAALLLVGLPAMNAEGRPAEGGAWAALASVRRDTAAALKYAWDRPLLLDAVLAKTPLSIAGGGSWVLLNLVASDLRIAGSSAIALGVLQCLRGVGTGVGPVLSAALVRRSVSTARAGQIAAFTAFGGMALFAVSGAWPLLIFATLAWGAGMGSNWVLSCAEVQRISPDRFVGRLSAADGLAWTLGMCASALAGAALSERTGTPAASAALGLALGVPVWVALKWLLARRSARPLAEGALALAPESQ